MTTPPAPMLTLNNGVQMPAFGLGVFLTPPDETMQAVEAAIADGYRLIDTAAAYGNEKEVGDAIRRSGIDRADIFVTTKLWITDYGSDSALRGFDASLERLGFDYVDLYLLHWPVTSAFDDTIASYKAIKKVLDDGRARAIGVSNFSEANLDTLMATTDVVPTVNQVELHPYFNQAPLRAADDKRGIITQSWSPIGGVLNRRGAERGLLDDPVVVGLAEKYGKSPAQVVLRWHLEHGLSTIPKSVRPQRIAENIDVFDFTLSVDDIAAFDALDTGQRTGPDPDEFDVAFLERMRR